jgi:hypothetical protein
VDEYQENIDVLYHDRGEDGLCELPAIGNRLAGLIVKWLRELEETHVEHG